MTPPGPHPGGWLEVAIDCHPVAREAVEAFLFDLGCRGIVTEDFESRAIRAYWAATATAEDLRHRLDAFLSGLGGVFPEAAAYTLRLSTLQDRDWTRAWRCFFRTERVTPGLTIVPAWEALPEEGSTRVLRVDPGPAFGTGKHPTTRMCLQAMEDAKRPPSWDMLDAGTGSGILALYGALLGASGILAVDHDPEALRWAGKNIALNGLEQAVELSDVPIPEIRRTFHLVAANLILGTILELLPALSPRLRAGGYLLLSGILREQVGRVEGVLADCGLWKERVLLEGEWACLVARRG